MPPRLTLRGPYYVVTEGSVTTQHVMTARHRHDVGIDNPDYWLLTPNELSAEKSPKIFSKEINVKNHEWYGRHPQIQPPHVWDLFNPYD